MGTSRVEAGSLSALNLLASNPPQYPHNPTEGQHEPLALYISRVPGTRDVILSTMKPQRKNVTGEDVANALYYIHLDLPSDSLIIANNTAPDRGSHSPRNSGEILRSPTSPIQRKPVPMTAKPSTRIEAAAPLVPNSTAPSVNVTTAAGQPSLPSSDQELPTHTPTEQQWPLVASYQQTTAAAPLTYRTASAQPAPRPTSQPWVPPGFHLDEAHSFEVANSIDTSNPPTPHHVHALPVRMRPPQAKPMVQAPVPRKPVVSQMTPSPGSGSRILDKELPPLNPDVRVQSPHTPRSSSPLRHSNANFDCPPMSTPPKPPPRNQDPFVRHIPSPKRPSSPSLVPFQLTLIRRDPSSNNQWNVGKVSSVQSAEPLSLEEGTETPGALDQPAIHVHLETSGYAKFRGFPSRHSIENASRDASTSSLPRSLPSTTTNKCHETASGFNRQVVMTYTKSWAAGIRSTFKRHDRSASENAIDTGRVNHAYPLDLEPPSRQRFLHVRNDSQTSVGSIESFTNDTAAGAGRESPTPLITRPGPGLKPRGYVFTSPWDGRCEFRTGNGGRTLKCRHTLNPTGSSPAGYNPLVMAQNIRDGQGIAAAGGRNRASSLSSAITGASAVSELRFNLPNAELLRPKHESLGVRGNELYGKLQNHLQKHRRQGSSTTDDDYGEEEEEEGAIGLEDSDVFLGLGKEKAGGGNRGKRVKLGKLIIYDDGFKMLDLVVASNIGIWWVAWEKNF